MTTPVANLEMAEAWDGPEGDHWALCADHYERVSWRHNERLLEQVGFAPDASVLDVGCGTGRSTRDIARIASRGDVLGIDLSSRMLQHARKSAEAEGLTNARFEQGDAQVHPLAVGAYDVAVSVFGAMFFNDPVAAFTNIRAAVRPGGFVALLTWRELGRNDWLTSVRAAAAMGRSLPGPQISQPGPLGLADPDYVRRVLGDAGLLDVALDEVDEPMEFGRDTDDAFAFISALGLTRGLVHDLDDDARARALDAVRQLIAERDTGDGVLFGSSAWLITARAALP